jgi:hypothetical protein
MTLGKLHVDDHPAAVVDLLGVVAGGLLGIVPHGIGVGPRSLVAQVVQDLPGLLLGFLDLISVVLGKVISIGVVLFAPSIAFVATILAGAVLSTAGLIVTACSLAIAVCSVVAAPVAGVLTTSTTDCFPFVSTFTVLGFTAVVVFLTLLTTAAALAAIGVLAFILIATCTTAGTSILITGVLVAIVVLPRTAGLFPVICISVGIPTALRVSIGLFITTPSIAALSPLVFALRAVTVFIEEPTTLGAILWAASTALTVTFALLLIALRRRRRSIDRDRL